MRNQDRSKRGKFVVKLDLIMLETVQDLLNLFYVWISDPSRCQDEYEQAAWLLTYVGLPTHAWAEFSAFLRT